MRSPGVCARVPGKLFLSGEYAVLQGAPAIACAVGRHVEVRFLAAAAAEEAEAARWRESAREALLGHGFDAAPAARPLEIDSRALYTDGGTKLGLGSSAAVAVGVSALALASIGPMPPLAVQLRIATDLHRARQGPGGSGVDIAACLYGGVIAVANNRVNRLRWPRGLHCAVFWTGRDAETGLAIQRFRQALDGEAVATAEQLSRVAGEVRQGWDRGAGAVLAALRNYAAAWRAMDEAANIGIYSRPHRRLDQLARAANCVYKPSGAGGGDCGLAFSTDPGRLDALRESARRDGLAPLELDLGVAGSRVRD